MVDENSQNDNPSIGRIGTIYFDKQNNRIKFFSEGIHQQEEEIADLVEQGYKKMKEEGATRLNARFLSKGANYKKNIEARIPLNNGFSGIELLFIGVNTPGRIDPPEIIRAEDEIIMNAQLHKRKNNHVLPEGYQIEKLTSQNLREQDINDLKEMYAEAFKTYTTLLDEKAIKGMIERSVVYVARYHGRIISSSVGEISKLNTPGRSFRICEMSEMSTKREHRGKGLIILESEQLIDDIRSRIDLIYAESRACHFPINRAFYDLGFSYAGRLNKQCILSGDHEVSEKGPYENLNVWYTLPKHE